MISKKLIHAIIFTPIDNKGTWGVPSLFWGEPGVAKTAIIENIGQSWDLPTETLSPGERGEGAFGVTPVPSLKMDFMTYPPPDWTTKFSSGRGIVFVDEVNLASPAIQPPILGLIQARRIGGVYLGGGVRMMGAANPPEISAGGWDLAPPVANRFAHFEWTCPTVDEWSNWLFDQSSESATGSAIAEEDRVLKSWNKPWAVARGHVAGFLRRRPELMHKRPESGDPNASKAWPSPRSWAYGTRSIAASIVHDLALIDSEKYLAACIGQGAANEFVSWRSTADLPDPVDVLDRKVEFEHDVTRLDRTMAVLSSCAALIVSKNAEKRNERAVVLWSILGKVVKETADIALGPARQLQRAGLASISREGDIVMGSLLPILTSTATVK